MLGCGSERQRGRLLPRLLKRRLPAISIPSGSQRRRLPCTSSSFFRFASRIRPARTRIGSFFRFASDLWLQSLQFWRNKMDIIIIISLVILLVLGALFVIPKSQNKGKSKENDSRVNGMKSRSYTQEEVSKHNTRKDCWIIIKDKVYDVTPYVEEHPGGDAILNNAGGDSTEGFFGPQHGTRVFDIIEDFCIGELKA